MDQISYLPDSILHDILSRLPDKDAARTSVLSKAWHDTWSTFPVLVFDESRYEMTKMHNDADIWKREMAFLVDKYKFCCLVQNTFLRFLRKRLAIRKFKLVFKSSTPPDLLCLVNDWIKVACDSGVEVLQLESPASFSNDEFTCLPLCILEAKSLLKLQLSWDFRVDQAFLNHPIKFSSLQVLFFSHVYLGDEQVIQNLFSSCPMIKEITLDECYGLVSLSIHGLSKLKRVTIMGIVEVDVDAPNLENLSYTAPAIPFACKISMNKCRNLRELYLAYVNTIIINSQWFLELFQKFPLLEKLILEGFYMPEMICISSSQLKVFDLRSCDELEEIWINAPNLYKCTYLGDGSMMPFVYVTNCSSQLVLDVVFYVANLLDLHKLMDFLQKIEPKHIPVSLFLGFGEDSTVEFDPFALLENPMDPPRIKHVTISAVSNTEECCLPLVNSLFCTVRPSTISFKLDASKTLVKMFCEKLRCRKEDACCSSSQVKCWWHCLKEVKVSSSFRKHNAAVDFKTLLQAFPTLTSEEEEEIGRFLEGDVNFSLEWEL